MREDHPESIIHRWGSLELSFRSQTPVNGSRRNDRHDQIVNIEVPVMFPLANVPIALAGTVALALLVLALPVRRAVRFRPGDALRYA